MKNKLLKLFKIKPIIAILFLLLFTFQSAVVTAALTFDGSTSSGKPGYTIDATGGYSIHANFVEEYTGRVAGYRFSVVDASGAQQFTPLDLIRYATCSADGSGRWYGGTGWNRLTPKKARSKT